MTKIVNLNNTSWQIYIGRRNQYNNLPHSIFYNPFTLKRCNNDRDECIRRFKEYFYEKLNNDPNFKLEVLKLKDKTLGCWCKPKKCHGDVIVEYLDGNPKKGLENFLQLR